jgi:hypothetical protein
MKNLNKLGFLGLILIFLWGCQKDEVLTTLNPNAVLTANISPATAVLLKDNAAQNGVTVSWVAPDFGFQAAPNYTVLLDLKGNNFSKAVTLGAGTVLSKSLKVSELNAILIGFGIAPGTAADLEIKVQSLIGTATVLNSSVLAFKATPYLDKLDLSTPWGVVGSATPGQWNGPDLPFYKTGVANELVAYVTLTDGEIKFRKNNDWAENLGGKNGVLSAGGDNIVVKAGSYRITMNPVALTYKIDKYSWGLVGSATPNAWNGPDLDMRYDATVDLWRAEVALADGEIKFRQNNDWANNFGGKNGVLSAGGDNITVKKGTYLITADFAKLKYTITPYKPWGIVGDATSTGWGDKPDQKFTYDLSTETWVLNGVVLKGTGGFKFRENDDWGNNLGAAGSADPTPLAASGDLVANGKNFSSTAGTWNFVLDLRNKDKLTYKAVKK